MNVAIRMLLMLGISLSAQTDGSTLPESRFVMFEHVSDSLVIGVLSSSRELALLDLQTGSETAWETDWSPEPDGWRQGGVWDIDVSPDGDWVLIARVFSVSSDVDCFIPGYEAVGLILSNADGSGARGIALGLCPAGGSMPAFAFTSDSRRIMGNDISTPYMVPEDFSAAINCDDFYRDRRDSVRYFDLGTMSLRSKPFDSAGGQAVYPDLNSCFIKSPWNDTALFYEIVGGGPPLVYQFRSIDIEGPVVDIQVPGDDYDCGWPVGWVSEDEVLFRLGESAAIVGTDGVFRSLPDSVSRWEFIEILSDGVCIFRRGEGLPLERGQIDWDDFRILSSTVAGD
jgi:hypothetical protein